MTHPRWVYELSEQLKKLGNAKAVSSLQNDQVVLKYVEHFLTAENVLLGSGETSRLSPLSIKRLRRIGVMIQIASARLASERAVQEKVTATELAPVPAPLVRSAVMAMLAPYQSSRWLSHTRPYRRLTRMLSGTDKRSELAAYLRQEALRAHQTPPGQSRVVAIATDLLARFGLYADWIAEVEALDQFGDERLLIGLLNVWQANSPVAAYATEPAAQALVRARVTLPVRAVTDLEGLHHTLDPIVGLLLEQLSAGHDGYDDLIEALLDDQALDRSNPRGLLKVIWAGAKQAGLTDLAHAAVARVQASSDTPQPAAVVAPVRSQGAARRGALPSTWGTDWTALGEALNSGRTGVPDEVMRSLLEAALRRVATGRTYGLPEVDYWVEVPDPYLNARGVHRLLFREDGRQVWAVTSPTAFTLEVGIPPAAVRGGALLLALAAAVTFCALVTTRDRFGATQQGARRLYRWHGPGAGSPERRPVTIARVRQTTAGYGHRIARASDRRAPAGASYVVPHLRLLTQGRHPSPDAVEQARQCGIDLPAGFTFVRGHIRGAGPGVKTVEYALADIVWETVRRFRSRRI